MHPINLRNFHNESQLSLGLETQCENANCDIKIYYQINTAFQTSLINVGKAMSLKEWFPSITLYIAFSIYRKP